ncbi:MAG: Ig-like domain-containing protein, partial [Bifidobacteriaceae bacterium]|nr:Ig-like domain-containing protein [Bifidobacteriaceae bacterium]
SAPVPETGHVAQGRLPVGSLSAGIHQVTATYTPPDPGASTVHAAAIHEVLGAATTTTAPTGTITVPSGGTVLLSGAVRAAFATMPTGQVEFLRGTSALGTAPLDAGGAFTYPLAAGAQGTDTITIRYLGDRDHLASQASVALAVVPASDGSSPPPTVTLSPTLSGPPPASPSESSSPRECVPSCVSLPPRHPPSLPPHHPPSPPPHHPPSSHRTEAAPPPVATSTPSTPSGHGRGGLSTTGGLSLGIGGLALGLLGVGFSLKRHRRSI